ncbi:MAG: Stage II sporulation E family protein [Thermoanaerobacterales bacterium 50_218]|nr:MAG: Stage II sporulation E family protein [Thermoanaerobacterales bacterium 50_218]HAA90187.1 hypothetical protein [Peptococcaceae bacterium]
MTPENDSSRTFGQEEKNNKWEVFTCIRPRCLEKAGGDFCYVKEKDGDVLVVLADVLGHGERAYQDAVIISEALQHASGGLSQVYLLLETAASRTRGCALFLASLKEVAIEYILIGNIRGWLVTPFAVEGLVRQPGIVGKKMVKPIIRHREVTGTAYLLVCSDGIRSGFSPTVLRHFWESSLATTACHVLGKYGIAEDDASVLVARRCV